MTLRSLVTSLLFFLLGVNGYGQEKDDNMFVVNQIQGPIFDNDQTNQKFREWVVENTDWNCLSELDCVGRIIVSFKVDRRGNLMHPKIYRGLHPHIDASVLQTIKSSPQWEPAKKNNRPVPSKQQVEIIVMLK